LGKELINKMMLRAPVNVTWEVTRRCNLACRHCLSADATRQAKEELSLSQCRQFVDELSRMKVFQVNFGGGEPFMRQDFLEILEYTQERGIIACVSTNGTLLDESLVRKLKPMDPLYIQISLDGATRETNDSIRGKGTYDRILAGVELLSRYNFPNFSINTVITRVNFEEIEEIYRLGRYYGARVRFSRFRPSGDGRRAWEDYHLHERQLVELAAFLSSHEDILTGDSFFPILAKEGRKEGFNMCGAARMTCGISPDGNVYPCAFLQDEVFGAGNITRQSLDSIWHDSPVFKMFRERRVEFCESCPRVDVCHGGCPAVTYFLTKSLNFPDPECLFQCRAEVG
jgi:mycofactocin radical SAM maturase